MAGDITRMDVYAEEIMRQDGMPQTREDPVSLSCHGN